MEASLRQAWEEYVRPLTVDEALAELGARDGRARVVAGATDLVIDIAKERKATACVVDVRQIAELHGIAETPGGGLSIGAATTHADLAASALVRRDYAALAAAAAAVGSLQIRNQGTVGGNVVNAQPAADTAVALAALDATAEIAGPEPGRRRIVSLPELYTGDVGRSAVDSTREILTRFFIAEGSGGSGSSFQRLTRRKALALPMLNCAIVLQVESDRIAWCRIAMGPVATVPFRCAAAERIVTGLRVDDEAGIQAAADAVTAEACPRDSCLRGSAEYRCIVAGTLAHRGLREAIARSADRGD